ncbi:chemotaxis protein CheW [Geminocystis sp. NIES-3709]|uniref:chemotaxis protein CheW n=1 Tax=Geminocystis sp. NIES-3709 TaxID=1617448 RepID=UPI0005FCD17F|nr:chemotaxis protein CheW [Geminocystis sp. NIES-3709]BAQ66761.1 purine-binding chemotaxis protein [Geminocystis sp. NIES-3709]
MSSTSTISRLQELLPQLFQASEIKGDRYLRFGINKLSVLIPMGNIQESLLVSGEKITPIPKMPLSMMGLISSREAVFCVFDLGQLIGLPPLSSYLRQYHVVVLKELSSDLLIGIAVHQIQGVTRVISEEICTDEEIYSLLPKKDLPMFLKNYFKGGFQDMGEDLLILDLPTLFSQIESSHLQKESHDYILNQN